MKLNWWQKNGWKIQFTRWISEGPTNISDISKVNFNNPNPNNNLKKDLQKIFLNTLKTELTKTEKYTPDFLNELQEFVRTDETMKRLQEEFDINVLGDVSDVF